jgi:flagellar assembly protein FliH
MLCKVLTEEPSKIGSPHWLSQATSAQFIPRQAGLAPQSSAEIQELRQKVETLTALLERSTKEAHDKGFLAGEAAARARVDSEMRAVITAFADKTAEIASLRTETIRRAEADTVRLAMDIARRVLHREISTDQLALSALTAAALEKLRNQEIYRIRLNPDLEKMLRAALERAGRSQSIELICDRSLSAGAIHFEIGSGSLDASIDTQLREIERGLADEIRTRT